MKARKLELKKVSIANLDVDQMRDAKGGYVEETNTGCSLCPSDASRCCKTQLVQE